MQHRSHRFLIQLGTLGLFLILSGGAARAQKVGTTSFQFLKVMPTARAVGMGDAYAALAGGVEAIFWNPAGLALNRRMEGTATHIPYLIDTRISSMGLSLSISNYDHIALQIQYVDYGELVETRVDRLGFNPDGTYNPGLTGQTFSPHAWAFGLSYGRVLTDQFRIGITGKWVYEDLYNGSLTFTDPETGELYPTSTSVPLFDFGIQYDTGYRSLRLGASVQNFGPEVVFVEENFSAPLTFRLGIAVDLLGQESLLFPSTLQRLTFAGDLMHPNDYDQQLNLGLEYSYAGLLALRVGRKINYDTESWTFGGGLHVDLRTLDFSFDVAYVGMGTNLGSAPRFTLGIRLK